ncbi:unnamed protein product [Acanthoscelides obtectus]|uniref:Prominin-like protein n=1 Tax=Acanthoscelides obtectus TaxID=200917 RepID=A0A9P0L4M2_ACAOB|nr:unnamed protein product [Acanthoscelides obtectus]CAK1638395.1 Prominin-like protein [Acanthoscelides obtectus]
MSARRKDGASTNADRAVLNYLHLAVTLAVLALAVHLGDGGFASSIDKITRNLDVALSDLSDDKIHYNPYNSTAHYVSDTAFNARGMAGLYNLTGKVMDGVLARNFLPKDLFIINHNPSGFSINQQALTFSTIIHSYWVILLVLISLVIVGVFLPICGLCFCCCRCAGKCGARTRPADKRRDLCRKVLLGAFLIALATGMLFCVVCAFASNQQLQDGINDFPKSMRNSSNDASTYINDTKRQASHLLVTNFAEFSDQFSDTLNKSEDYVMEQLTLLSNATAMTELQTFVKSIPKIQANLELLKQDTNSLRVSASQLNDAMRKVKADLLQTLQDCNTLPKCAELNNNISKLQTNIDFNKLPDVSQTIDKLKNLPLRDLSEAVDQGAKRLGGIKIEITTRLKNVLIETKNTVSKSNDTIQEKLKYVDDTVDSFQRQVDTNVEKVIQFTEKHLKEYGDYRNYGGLGISCVILLVTIFLALGLICGICGKRPDGYSDNCCNKGTGGQFLICAVMIMFIFGFVIAAVTIVALLGGLLTDRVVCYPLRNPESSTVLDVISDYTKSLSDHSDLKIDVKQMLIRCYRNETLYEVFELERKFSLEEIKQQFNLSKYIKDMQDNVNNIIDDDFYLLDETNRKTLEKLSDFDPGVDFGKFQDELKQNFTNLSLDEILDKLKEIVAILDDERYLQTKSELNLSILHIDTYNEKLLKPMNHTAYEAIETAIDLDESLRMNSSDFHTAIQTLMDEIISAEHVLKEKGSVLIQEVVQKFGDIISSQVNSYIDLLEQTIKHDFAKCGPLSNVVKSTLTATCDKILLPLNGFWVTLLLTLALFIPTIVVSVKLASLYQKYKPNGGYVETEYLYDAYADRDNIPLNSHGKQRGKKKAKKGRKYEDRPQNMGGEVVAREYAMGSHHQPDSRYGDMAPNDYLRTRF